MSAAPDDVTVFARAVLSGTISAAEIASFRSAGAISPRDGVENYRRMFVTRQIAALEELFPVARSHLGAAGFARHASSYVREHRSTSAALEQVGADFPSFLLSAGELVASELAAVEWACLWVFLAADGAHKAEPRKVPLPDSVLVLGQAFDVVSLGSAARAAWSKGEGPHIACNEARDVVDLLVWRAGLQCRLRVLPEEEAEALRRAHEGAAFSFVCEAFAASPAPVAAAFRCVQTWLDSGILHGFAGPA
ncbi:MAG TPA: putative DNA-binding domain-containing protein [Sorangium sp.]|nr:putative DNA-binding domain-containing protein [Sorangium sp.]